MSDIPEWAMEEARKILYEIDEWTGDIVIARALVKAKEQGIAECRETLMEQMRRGIAEYQEGPKP